MPQVINTNIASLNAQRNLNASQADSNVALQRLSSGLRINSAKDDAAGLAISERFQSQIAGLNQAQRNANDGISLAQTAEGAMDEITNNLQRIRELAVQSANATNSISDRQALNQEVQQRIEEINRIASQTSFNGLKVLDGTFSTQTFQVGANTGETIAISGLDSRGSQIGAVVYETEGLSSSVIADAIPTTTESNDNTLNFGSGGNTISGSVTINDVPVTIDTKSYQNIGEVVQNLNEKIGALSAEDAAAVSDIVVGSDGDKLTFTSSRDSIANTEINLMSGAVLGNGVTDENGTVTQNDGELSVSLGASFSISDQATGSITIDSVNGGDPIVFDFTDASDTDSFLDAINTALTDATVTDLEATGFDAETGELSFKNSSTTQDFVITDLDLRDAPGVKLETGKNVTNAEPFQVVIGSAFEFSESATGAIAVNDANSGALIEFDFSEITDSATLIAKINESLADSALEATAYDPASGTLTFTNTDTANAVDITALELLSGSTSSAFDQTLAVESQTGTTLSERLSEGEPIDFKVDINGTEIEINSVTSLNDIVSRVNAESNETGINANLNALNNEIIFSTQFGEEFSVSVQADIDGDGVFDGTDDLAKNYTATAEEHGFATDKIDISTRDGADLAMITVDYAIDTINSFRAQLGAVQNRFESTIANLSTTSENLSASNSRIRDADFAAETAELARTQVLQSAGLSVLAQANARPQQVLQLLQG